MNIDRRAQNPFSTGWDWIESKGFSGAGKVMCLWLMYKYSEDVIDSENVLFVLLLFVIMPDLVRKFLSLVFQSKFPVQGYVTHHEHEKDSTTLTPVDAPPKKSPKG